MRRATVAAGICCLLSGPSGAGAATLPKEVATYLRSVAGFAPDRIAAVESGEAISKIAADEEGEIAIVGAVRVRTTRQHVEDYLDVYMKHEDGALVLRVGRFGKPPVLEDLARLELEKDDIDALRDCRPGACAVQIGGGFAQFQAAVNWRAPDAGVRAQALAKQRLLDYVLEYQEKGDAALVTYNDESKPLPLSTRWRQLLGKAAYFYEYAPQLQRYLVDYPRLPLPGTTDFIQWSKVDQGLKPVVLVTHVVMHKDPAQPERLTVAMKQIYASRYYEGAFSVATVVEASAEPPVSYVVFANRSRLDVLRGRLGGVKRRVTSNEVLKATQLTLEQIRDALERAAGPR